MNCIDNCSMIGIKENQRVYCKFYGVVLETTIADKNQLKPKRCSECEQEEIIGSNTIEEELVKTEKCLNIIMNEHESFAEELAEKVSYIKANIERIRKYQKEL